MLSGMREVMLGCASPTSLCRVSATCLKCINSNLENHMSKINKLKPIVVALMVAGASTLAMAEDAPSPPPFYNTGPISPFDQFTEMTLAERKFFAGLESAMTLLEAYAHEFGCPKEEFAIDGVADRDDFGAIDPAFNYVMLDGVELLMAPLAVEAPLGQTIATSLAGGIPGPLGDATVRRYRSELTYNGNNTIMDGDWGTAMIGQVGVVTYKGLVIKDFYRGTDDPGTPAREDRILFDWGLQSVSKTGYPVEKWWQRSKTKRSDGGIAKTVWVKDRLVGNLSCRITLNLTGINDSGFIDQFGTATISWDEPQDDTPGLDGVAP